MMWHPIRPHQETAEQVRETLHDLRAAIDTYNEAPPEREDDERRHHDRRG